MENKRVWTRRELFSTLGAFLFLGCQKRLKPISPAKSESTPLQVLHSQTKTPSPDKTQTQDPSKKQSPTAQTQAQQAQITACPNYIDLSTFDDAPEQLSPKLFLYGSQDSALIAITMPFYQHGTLQSIYILTEKGEVLAQKAILSDVTENKTLRPVIFDNCNLRNQKRLSLLFEKSCQTCSSGKAFYKWISPTDVIFETKFRNKPVLGISKGAEIAQNYQSNQGFCDFIPQTAGFIQGQKDVWQVVSDDSVYRAQGGLFGFIITDLGGKVLSENGKLLTSDDPWGDITHYSYVIVYKSVQEAYYVRTFLRVS